MKTLEQVYGEIQKNEELKKEFAAALKENKVEDFLKSQDCDATVKDVMAYMANLKNGELSDDDLDQVSGGLCTSVTCNVTCECGTEMCY